MRTKWYIWLPLVILVVVSAAIWAAGSWLESPAGRARLESALADAVNMPVRLVGDFNISFWPAMGIAGRTLEVGGDLLQCDSYHVSVALWPLLQGELIVLAVRAADGKIDPGQLSGNEQDLAAEAPRPVRLPRVDFLQLENFQVRLDGKDNFLLELHRLEVNGFRVDTATPLELAFSITRLTEPLARIEVESAFTLDGEVSELVLEINRLAVQSGGWDMDRGGGALTWSQSQDEITLELAGQAPGLATANFSGAFSPGTLNGKLAMEVLPADHQESLRAGFSFQPMPRGIGLAEVRLESMDQRIDGTGCFLTGNEPSLQLELEAATIDLDRLQAWLPAGGGPDAGLDPANLDLPLGLNIRLSVDEVRGGGVIAHGVEMEIGAQPDCSPGLE